MHRDVCNTYRVHARVQRMHKSQFIIINFTQTMRNSSTTTILRDREKNMVLCVFLGIRCDTQFHAAYYYLRVRAFV